MSQVEDGAEGDKAESRARGNHWSNPGSSAVSTMALHRALCAIGLENATVPEISRRAFGGRASIHTVRSWVIGKRHVSPWAIEWLVDRLSEGARAANEIPRGPGSRAGVANLLPGGPRG